MKITVPPGIDRALTAQARKRGTTAELVALDSLRKRFVRSRVRRGHDEREGSDSQSLTDFLDGSVGVLHSSDCVPGGGRVPGEPGRSLPKR